MRKYCTKKRCKWYGYIVNTESLLLRDAVCWKCGRKVWGLASLDKRFARAMKGLMKDYKPESKEFNLPDLRTKYK